MATEKHSVDYIGLISNSSNEYGNPHLISLMDYYGVNNLRSITQSQAKEYYERFVVNEKIRKENC